MLFFLGFFFTISLISFLKKQPKHLIMPILSLNLLALNPAKKPPNRQAIRLYKLVFTISSILVYYVSTSIVHFPLLCFLFKLRYYDYPVYQAGGVLCIRWSLKSLWLLSCWPGTIIALISHRVFHGLSVLYSWVKPFSQAQHATVLLRKPNYHKLSL